MIMNELHLIESDRAFLHHVCQAIFANPFSDDRAEVDRVITGSTVAEDEESHIDNLIKVVADCLGRIFDGHERVIMRFSGVDRELVLHGALFHLYHKYCGELDTHISDQLARGTALVKVAFAERVLGEMQSLGMARREAIRNFSLFFQMRRAYFFINRIVGPSACMKELRRNLWNNIFTHDISIYEQHLWNRMEDFSTMLLGPTGTGKGMAAAAIGRSGYIPYEERSGCFAESFTRAFISINLSQYPEQLVESELFGHKKGAFTGAVEHHDGIFSLCSPVGAILLDEIGEVTIPVQIKLLQVLQERVFNPVGSHQKKRFYGRVIGATNQPVEELRRQGVFRDDFFYRLCSDIIYVPPLHQRIQETQDELNQLLAHTLERITGKADPELVQDALEIIRAQIPPDYPWPGNVRELEQCARRILLKRQYEGDRSVTSIGKAEVLDTELIAQGGSAQNLLSRYCRLLYGHLGTYEAVAKKTELDRRTVKKYIDSA